MALCDYREHIYLLIAHRNLLENTIMFQETKHRASLRNQRPVKTHKRFVCFVSQELSAPVVLVSSQELGTAVVITVAHISMHSQSHQQNAAIEVQMGNINSNEAG